MINIYMARSMTGRVKEEVVAEAKKDKEFLEKSGLMVLCPVIEEGVKPTQEKLLSSKKAMDSFWPRDKQMIREAHVVFDNSPHLNSEGVKHELGYARYNLWKPVVRIFPTGKLPPKSSVSFYEDDYICDSLEEAVEYVLRKHGTWKKRFKWRWDMINRCLPKWLKYQIQEWVK